MTQNKIFTFGGAVLLIVVIVGLIAFWREFFPVQGLKTPEDVVSRYVAALQRGDKEEILRLNAPKYNGVPVVDSALQKKEGRTFQTWTITMIPHSVDSSIMNAKIDATYGDGKKYTEALFLENEPNIGTRGWFLVMGQYTGKDRVIGMPTTVK